ncbi:MAG: hypothetical protein H6738_16305 [Alphaproteobacteria bacterium]|nr:hypothetical protein [Alphaproteobacteria bacterium]MCB9698343.1 hypothetical protein [Alphaproteobacteria bacterium]
MASTKTNFVLTAETAKMARALDGISSGDRTFVAETITFLGSEVLDTEEVAVNKEAGLLALRIERMSEADRNVLKGLVSRILAKNKERPATNGIQEKSAGSKSR